MQPFLERAADVALRHHERWDGSGYPGGLRGDACSFDARIVAVVDVYDALGQVRCYKPGWSEPEIEQYFAQSAGRLFEGRIVEALLDSRPRLREIAKSLPEPTPANELVGDVAAPAQEFVLDGDDGGGARSCSSVSSNSPTFTGLVK